MLKISQNSHKQIQWQFLSESYKHPGQLSTLKCHCTLISKYAALQFFCTLRQPLSCLYHYIILICFRVLTPQRCFKNFVVLLAMTIQAILFYSFKVLDGFQWSVMFCTFLNGTTSHYLNFETYKCYLKGKYQIQAIFLKNTGMKKKQFIAG